MRKRIPYVVIVCPGHSGSTLLAMCLNAHPHLSVFGEFSTLARRAEQIISGERHGLCSFCDADCEVHTKAEISEIEQLYYAKNKYLRRAKSILFHSKFVTSIYEKTEARWLVDSSKSIRWARSLTRWHRRELDVKYIFLSRDGRSCINSWKRKNSDKPLSDVIRQWKKTVASIIVFKKELDPKDYVNIKYEDLACDPQAALSSICSFLNIGFVKEMLDYPSLPQHIVGGNAGARTRVNMVQKQSLNKGRKDIDWYIKQTQNFFYDERWKSELTGEELDLVTHSVGELNRILGYKK